MLYTLGENNEIRFKEKKLREINNTLQDLNNKKNDRDFVIINPEGVMHYVLG